MQLAYPSFDWSPDFRRKALSLAVLGLAACMVGLLAGAPASLLLKPAISGSAGSLHGSIWRGAAIRPNGAVIHWDAKLADTILAGRLSGRWTLQQPGASLGGEFGLGQSSQLSDVSGRITLEALRSFLSDLPQDCSGVVDLRDLQVRLGADDFGVTGEVNVSSLVCAGKDGPDLKGIATIAGSVNTLQVVSVENGEGFAEGEVFPDGRLSLRLLPAGAAFVSPNSQGKTVAFEAELRPIG